MFLELKLPNFPGEIQRGLAAPTPPMPPALSMNSPHFPPVCRGEVRRGEAGPPWVPGVLSTRITRRKKRAAEWQSRFILVALQEGSSRCWGWTELLISWLRGRIRPWGGEWARGGAGSVLFIVWSPYLTVSPASLCRGQMLKNILRKLRLREVR